MSRYIYLAVVTIALLSSLFLSNIVGAAGSDNYMSPLVQDDTVNGRVTLETDSIKAVWHYKTLPGESNNQGGGSLYELYYKPMDAGLQKNLVSFANRPNWGDGRSYVMVGIGGIGSSGMYATNQPPATGTNSFDDLVSDNNLGGELLSYSIDSDASGNTILVFSFAVKSQSTNSINQPAGGYWYRVDKKWIVEPDGLIHLEVTRTILSTGYFSEPAVRMNWSGETNVGWNKFEKYGRDWGSPNNPLYYRAIADISQEQGSCFNYFNTFHPDWIALTGSESAPSVKVVSDNEGRGFTGSGSYALGASMWGPASSSVEQCSFKQAVSSYGIGWYAWWGGNPPGQTRYKQLTAGTTWKDTFRIELIEGSIDNAPVISNVSLNGQQQGGASFSWLTDKAADTRLERRVSGGSWNAIGYDATPKTNHALITEDYDHDAYEYLVKNMDSAGNISIRQISNHSDFGTSLLLSKRSTNWNSYSDYTNGILAVEFAISNNSLSAVHDVNITSATASDSTVVNSLFPISVGGIQGNSQASFLVKYQVPYGVRQFRSSLTATATGPNGEIIRLP